MSQDVPYHPSFSNYRNEGDMRGWEVRHSFFTDQFKDAIIKPDLQLDKSIDGISGATLSVRALRKLARLALFLDQHVRKQ